MSSVRPQPDGTRERNASRKQSANETSTGHQPGVNRSSTKASTERQPVINETSTEHQIGDFFDENGNNATLVAINGTRSMVWLTECRERQYAGRSGLPCGLMDRCRIRMDCVAWRIFEPRAERNVRAERSVYEVRRDICIDFACHLDQPQYERSTANGSIICGPNANSLYLSVDVVRNGSRRRRKEPFHAERGFSVCGVGPTRGRMNRRVRE